jgi:stage II sporulation protein D
MSVINKVDIEKYITSVIDAEFGNNAPFEYYKAQAVLIRTFTIKNMLKHAEDGFNLCDGVHCQAYRGRLTLNSTILDAARSTSGKVLTDSKSVVIVSPFHSNCGGETSNAGLVWQKDLPYLRSVKDPFCTKSSQAMWTRTVERNKWIDYINNSITNNINYTNYNFTFQIPHRTKAVFINGVEINLRSVRERFLLKSSFFSVEDTGKEIIIKGKGYGHGVGMCQQGAIEMARVGYTWLDILHFYFWDIEIADYRNLDLNQFKPE